MRMCRCTLLAQPIKTFAPVFELFFSENNQYAYIYFNMLPIILKLKGDGRESAISGVLFYPNLIETSSDGELRLALDTWMFTASSSLICFSSDLAMLFS